MSKNELTEKQSKFLDLLYRDGLPVRLIERAKEIKAAAGYSENTDIYGIIRLLKDEIIERNIEYMVLHSSESITALQEIVRTPTLPGADTQIKAINSLLDRSGFGKKETQEVEVKEFKGIVILPPKKD